ncbi:hypothetical protein [Actinophytocola oryzae]|uniref:Transglutaminase superfamily protein n=1 Tax=Actinophytocola oryzae TaxID=502181 RepID=A0A4R7V465_9PSEU|nr:hypothetical protein [Actinophytocola oryzae]TDV42266.1 hypothetical protein CLV71_118136 [Actinophytocola oryzae]
MTFLIPPEYHVADTPRAEAARILDCTEEALDAFVSGGLTVSDDLFDSRDLFNLGLHSGSGRTLPEQAFAYALRWMRSPTPSLLAPRTSRFSVRLSCACASAAFAPPCDATDVEVTATSLTATIRTRGELSPLRSPDLVSLVGDFTALGLRWVKLPDALRHDEDVLLTHRVASCDSASSYLARRCLEAGFAARTRRGWVIGMLDLVHAWVEVTDSDGVTKVIDPIFALLATSVTDANPVLTDPSLSLRTNRLVPTDSRVGEHVAEHDCDLPATIRITQLEEKS